MKRAIGSTLLVTVMFALAGGARATLAAGPAVTVGTATPASTITSPVPTTPTIPQATATPASAMRVSGSLWINARPAGERFAAFIGEVECAHDDQVVRATDGGLPVGELTIPSAADHPGCGTPGALVRFTIDGMPANETVRWQPNADVSMRFIVGPAFAIFSGTFRHPSRGIIVAFIGDRMCGEQVGPSLGGPSDVAFSYGVIVDPAALHAGCGTPGAIVRFAVEVFQGDGTPGTIVAFADQTAVWQPGGETKLDLTFAGAGALPPTGAGARADGRMSVMFAAGLLALLGVAGSVMLAAGIAGRRRVSN